MHCVKNGSAQSYEYRRRRIAKFHVHLLAELLVTRSTQMVSAGSLPRITRQIASAQYTRHTIHSKIDFIAHSKALIAYDDVILIIENRLVRLLLIIVNNVVWVRDNDEVATRVAP